MPKGSGGGGGFSVDRILIVLLVIVIGLALVSTVATSTSSASTALAPFSGAQSLVIIVPLVFVAIILFAAVRHIRMGRSAAFDMKTNFPNLGQRLIPKL